MIPQLIEKKIIDAITTALSSVAFLIGDDTSRSAGDDGGRSATPVISRDRSATPGDDVCREAAPSLLADRYEDDEGREAAGSRLPIQIFGVWQPSAVGYLKNQEEAASVATIAVAVGTLSRDIYSTGTATYSGSIVLNVRAELDPTGQAFLALAAPIEKLLKDWQGSTYQQSFTALDVPGFSVGSLAVSGGNTPQMDFSAKTITLSWPFALSGSDAD